MREIQNLYFVKSRGFRAYVVATDTDSAWEKFKKWLDEKDYGYYWDREFQSIELIATDGHSSPKSDTGTDFEDSRKDDLLFV